MCEQIHPCAFEPITAEQHVVMLNVVQHVGKHSASSELIKSGSELLGSGDSSNLLSEISPPAEDIQPDSHHHESHPILD